MTVFPVHKNYKLMILIQVYRYTFIRFNEKIHSFAFQWLRRQRGLSGFSEGDDVTKIKLAFHHFFEGKDSGHAAGAIGFGFNI